MQVYDADSDAGVLPPCQTPQISRLLYLRNTDNDALQRGPLQSYKHHKFHGYLIEMCPSNL